jgi:protein-S-isoprenylcysteine O-methyltransferase Ste14
MVGGLNAAVSLSFMVAGWLFANWVVRVQYSFGKGTPIPIMATQKLIDRGPCIYCRNPMALGATVFYLGIAIWVGSVSAVALVLIYPIGILIYIRLVEEKELEARFGQEYVEYKRSTPFLIPHFRKRNDLSENGVT